MQLLKKRQKKSRYRYVLNSGSTRIGRKNNNNIIIKHQLCSKYHATITIRGDIIHYHDFSRTASRVMKRIGFQKLNNETARLYENSKIRIANTEYKVIKLKNLHKEDTEVIKIDSDSDEEINECIDKNENENKTLFKWKQEILKRLIESDSENNELNDPQSTSSHLSNTKHEEIEKTLSNIKRESDDEEFDFDLYNQ